MADLLLDKDFTLMNATVVGNAEIARLVDAGVRKLVAGKIDQASARCDLMLALRKQGLWDLAADEDWRDAILDINTQLQQGCRQHNEGIDEAILDAFPAQELFGLSKSSSEPYDWQQRWRAAGGQVFNERMVALKNSDIWTRISDFGFPFPPYARGSGLWVKDVRRSEAMQLGLIDRDRQIRLQRVAPPALMLFEPESQPDEEV